MITGKSHDMGLGPLHTVSLAEARAAARVQRLRHAGQDPIEARSAEKLVRRAVAAKTQTSRTPQKPMFEPSGSS